MDVIVQLAPALADAVLAQDSSSAAARAVRHAPDSLGVSLQALHPGATDRELRTYFRAAVPGASEGEDLISALLALDGVQAAYLQPEAELP